MMVNDNFQLTVHGAPNQPVVVVQTSNGVTSAPYRFGTTDASGNFIVSGSQPQSNVGSYLQQWSVGGVPAAPELSFIVTASPIVQFTNTSHPGIVPNFDVGDSFTVNVAGRPNQPVAVVQTLNGIVSPQFTFKNTDYSGNFSVSGVQSPSSTGIYTQVWSVGGSRATPSVSFVVGQLGAGGSISTTDLGETSDGHVEGISTLTINNGTVNTYSETALDYAASLYYDAGTVGTLYEEGSAVRTGSASASGAAGGYLSAPASSWDDYDLQTDHYVVAYLVYGTSFDNPLYYQAGSCGDVSSDCNFGQGGGSYYIAVASIYLGSTLADQTNVPQDGNNIPLVADSAYNSFIQYVPPPAPAGITFKVDAWANAIKNAIPALFIAENVFTSQNSGRSPYPLPLLLDLVDDMQSPGGGGRLAQRSRTYIVKDTFGHPWVNSNPLTIYENLIYVSGSGGMPPANNPSTPGAAGWTTSNQEIDYQGKMRDYYGQLVAQPEVDYWQQYWATGFNVPPQGFSLPAIPGYSGLTVPLMIKDKLSKCSSGFFGTQGVELRSDYVGINGDKGPRTPCAH